jgi:hypothetical protein
MCKELLVIPVNKVVDPKRIIGKNGGLKEEERHKGSLTQKNVYVFTQTGIFVSLHIARCSVTRLELILIVCHAASCHTEGHKNECSWIWIVLKLNVLKNFAQSSLKSTKGLVTWTGVFVLRCRAATIVLFPIFVARCRATRSNTKNTVHVSTP